VTGFLTGSYTAPKGSGAGIGVLDDGRWRPVADAVESPSFVLAHPRHPVVYAAAEFERRIHAFRWDDGRLVPLGAAQEAGAAACHLRLSPSNDRLVATGWADGSVASYPIADDGALGAPAWGAHAVDPYDGAEGEWAAAPRQSRGHASLFLDDETMLTTDLGFDLLRMWSVAGGLRHLRDVPLPHGTGPRHLLRHPDGPLHIVTEYSNEVLTFVGDELAGRTPITASGMAQGDTAAEIALHPSGRWLTVTVRGSNRLVVLSVDGTTVRPVTEVATGGVTPRHHAHDGDLVLVANQRSHEVVRFAMDAATGDLARLDAIAVGSPTCLAPLPVY
jgi:6-phosphogluconolactonase